MNGQETTNLRVVLHYQTSIDHDLPAVVRIALQRRTGHDASITEVMHDAE